MVDHNNLCVLIPSCDKYSDLWDPFSFLFDKYWPDCSYPIYLGSNETQFSDSRISQILIGEDRGWSDNLIKMLSTLGQSQQYSYVLLLLDDFFFKERVDSNQIYQSIKVLDELGGHYLRLKPQPPPDKKVAGDDFLGEISRGEAYRVSLQASLWRIETLNSLLQPSEGPWELEIHGSQRSDSLGGFYCTWKAVLKYINAVERGKWYPETLEFLASEGYALGDNRRSVLTEREVRQRQRYKRLLFPWLKLPLKYRMLLRSKITQKKEDFG